MEKREEQDIFNELKSLCKSEGYIHAIAYLNFVNNVSFYQDELKAEDIQGLYDKSRLIRTEISTLIALALQGGLDFTFPGTDKLDFYVVETYKLLEEMHTAILSSGDTEGKEGGGNFVIRESIFYSAESAYDFQYLELAIKKYSKDHEWIKSNLGLDFSNAVKIISSIDDLLKVRAEGVVKDIVECGGKGICDLFSLTAKEISQATGVLIDDVDLFLSLFSITNNSNVGFNSVSDYNEFNSRPIIRINDRYYFLVPYALAQSVYESPFFWFSKDKKYAHIAAKHRGEFVEDYTFDKMFKIFGKGNVYKNAFIINKRGETIGEIDVLVIFSECIVSFQAKSKKLTIEARKGNDNAIKKDFQGAIQDACDQGLSCSTMLLMEDFDKHYILTDADFKKINLRSKIKKAYIVPIISEHYPALSFQASNYLKFNATNSMPQPFVMDVFLLDVLTEFLDSPLYFISYVDRRCEYGNKIFSSHELTIFSFHLKQNLWMEEEHDFYILDDDICSDLDIAMMSRRKGVEGKKTPDGILTLHQDGFIRRIIRSLEDENDVVALKLGLILLSLGSNTINDLNEMYKKTLGLSKFDRNHHDLTTMLGDTGITFHSNYHDFEFARDKLYDHCIRRKYICRAKQWIGVLIHPDNNSVLYGFMLDFDWFFSDEMEEKTQNRTIKNTLVRVNGAMTQVKKVGRNSPCVCGSGKKYKKCCLR
ncbi:zinc chelation protein SecC [Pantoea graminicola]|uniref:YecA family protein n=1 Tax=Pantoea sp. ARC607 TaxID=2027922 RepID=UPI000DA98F0E|nr:SEC-C metal-binding domain-containing protein [Pantoea sp. ARC607]PZL93630.1 zinc chelation protein SecC [Pantoea sp. ARC607]